MQTILNDPEIDAFLQRFTNKALWIQFLVLIPVTLFVLLVLWVVSLATALGIGFRDGCVNGGAACAIPVTQLIELILVPATFILLLVSVVSILRKRILGYKLFAICIGLTIVQAIIPGNYVFPLLQEVSSQFFPYSRSETPSPARVLLSEDRRAALGTDVKEYKDEKRKFSIEYPSKWTMVQNNPGGRSSAVYAGNVYLNFYPSENSSSNAYKIFRGFDIQIYDNETLAGFAKNLSKESPDIHITQITSINGFAGFQYDNSLADMVGEQQIHTQVLQVGNKVFEIRADRNESLELQRYIGTIQNLP
ncbi:hypothetical protein EXS70_00275 [Candidatus Peribacteria bacterium]|nr:hypothetical protein [Candidatus Peribacteria bacterium]